MKKGRTKSTKGELQTKEAHSFIADKRATKTYTHLKGIRKALKI